MNLYLGVTDHDWFRYLAARQPEEVNFWQPGGGRRFRALEPGGLFLFKLKAPLNAIGGGGFFVRHAQLDAHTAWETFGVKNGAPDYWSFLDRLQQLRRGAGVSPNPQIGCIVLAQPFFFAEADWIPVPTDWASQIVSGKGYGMSDAEGRRLWSAVQDRLAARSPITGSVAEEPARYGERIVQQRLGQGAFRLLVTEAYGRRCAFTGERTLPALQAAHIKPYAASGPHRVQNGLLLRADIHQLFDSGYLTVDAGRRAIEVSARIREEFENGREYYALHGQALRSPTNAIDGPERAFLDYHNERVFRP